MGRKLMVVAHPDDESIFGGAQLLTEQGWKVICVTNGDHKIRRKEFITAMEFVQADYEIWTYPDKRRGSFDREALIHDLQRILFDVKYEKIVTHNLRGEYGHNQHIVLSKVMHELVRSNLFVFHLGENRLPDKIIEEKNKLLEIYHSQKKVIKRFDNFVIKEEICKAR